MPCLPPEAMIWDPSDANPLHRRLPAEIISRRVHKEKKVPGLPRENAYEEVIVDQKTAVTLKPDARPKWLLKACKMTLEGKASSTELYNIVVSRRFSAGLPERIGRKMANIVQANLTLFSDKQRRHLCSSEFQLNAHMAEAADEVDEDLEGLRAEIRSREARENPQESSREKKVAAKEVKSEAMLATCRAFVREQADTFEDRRKEVDQKEAEEADRLTRMVEDAAKQKRREATLKEERRLFLVGEAEMSNRKAAEKEADQKRKLEEEADALFERALVPVSNNRGRERRRGRSRSVSAQRCVSESPPRRKADWKRHHPGELTGSRALLLNPNYQEDLPHLQRPLHGGRASSSFGAGGASRSRSRSRSRRKRRR